MEHGSTGPAAPRLLTKRLEQAGDCDLGLYFSLKSGFDVER